LPRNDVGAFTVSAGPTERAKWEAIKEGKLHVRQEEVQPLRPSTGKSNEHNTSTSSHSARDAPAPEDKVPDRQNDSLGSLFEDDELPASQSRDDETPASQSGKGTPASQSGDSTPIDLENEIKDSLNSFFEDDDPPGSQNKDNAPLNLEKANQDSLSSLFEDDGTSDYLPEEE
jgi:hypothetical protein